MDHYELLGGQRGGGLTENYNTWLVGHVDTGERV